MGTGDTRITNPRALWIRQTFGRMYYNYKPHKQWWVLMIMARKFGIAITALMFNNNPGFQLSVG
jgi:hypothetical protein